MAETRYAGVFYLPPPELHIIALSGKGLQHFARVSLVISSGAEKSAVLLVEGKHQVPPRFASRSDKHY